MPQLLRITTHGLTDASRIYRAGEVVEATTELLALVGQHVELLEDAAPAEVVAEDAPVEAPIKRGPGRPRRIQI